MLLPPSNIVYALDDWHRDLIVSKPRPVFAPVIKIMELVDISVFQKKSGLVGEEASRGMVLIYPSFKHLQIGLIGGISKVTSRGKFIGRANCLFGRCGTPKVTDFGRNLQA
jgi:hypothetical protein